MSQFSFASPDAVLVRDALADEPRAFETLVFRYQRRAHAIARAAGVSVDSLEDVVQEAFIQAFRGLGELRSASSFGPWFLKIVRNLSLRYQQKRLLPGGREAVELDELAAPRSETIDAREERERLWRAVEDLPEGIREVMFLYYYEGRSTRRVAQSLDISRSAVKTRLKRGRDLLRERLWRAFGDALREEVPSIGAWRQSGRRLALLIMASAHRDVAARGAAGSSFLATPTSTLITAGALIMKAKSLLIALALGSLAWLGSWLLLSDGEERELDGARELAATRGTPTVVTPEPERSATSGAGETEPRVAVATGIAGTVIYEDSRLAAPGASVAAILKGTTRHAEVTSTGDDGRYLLAGLQPGEYRIWCWKEDWAMLRSVSWPAHVEVVEGEVTRDVDRLLEPGVVVAGEVVEAGSGRPIAGAAVRFSDLQFAGTDDRGRFRLEGIPEGLHRLAARAPDFVCAWIEVDVAHGDSPFLRFELGAAGVIEGTVSGVDGRPVEGARVACSQGTYGWWTSGSVRSSATGRYRLEGIPLDSASGRIWASIDGNFAGSTMFRGFPPGETRATVDLRLTPGYLFAGRVTDTEGEPVAGVELHLTGLAYFSRVYTTDDDGRFVIEGASERIFALSTRKESFAPASVLLRDIAPAERETIEITLEPGHFVAGVVVDTEEEPVEGAYVYVEETGRMLGGPQFFRRTGADGRFRIDDLPSELGEIGALKRGYTDNRFNPVKTDRDDIRLVLEEAGQIHGVVVDRATGDPVHPVLVKITLAEGKYGEKNREGKWRGSLSASLGETGLPFAEVDGSFKIRNDLAPGFYYKLIVQAAGYREAVVNGVEAWSLSEAREPLRFELEEGGVLRGQVVGAQSGDPIPAVKVSHLAGLRNLGWGYWSPSNRGEGRAVRVATTDAEGRFAIDGLADEPGVLLLDKSGYARTAFFRVGPGSESRTFPLDVAAAIAGSVKHSTGEPVAGATVSVKLNQQSFPGVRTDSDGRYRIGGLPAGTAALVLERRGSLRKHETVETVPGEVASVDFVEFPGSIAGRVTRYGEAVRGVRVRLTNLANSEERNTINTDEGGVFRVGGLAPGRYDVKAELPESRGFFPEEIGRAVEVHDGETRCDISLTPAKRVHGVVVDRVSGAPVTRGTIVLHRHHPEMASPFRGFEYMPVGSVTLDGTADTFEFDIAKPGSFVITVHRDGEHGAAGWLGPLDLGGGASPESLTVLTGGPGRLDVRVRQAGAASPLESVRVTLRPLPPVPIHPFGVTDTSGHVVIENLPAGRYRLHVAGGEHGDFLETIAISDGSTEKTIDLARASWIVVDLDVPPDYVKEHSILAFVISGDDPGWPHRSRDGNLPLASNHFAGRPLRIKIRPGRYRIRLEVKESYTNTPNLEVSTVDVVVPDGGEAAVTLPLGR